MLQLAISANRKLGNFMNKIKAIVFDFGGVLLDWNPRYLYREYFIDDPTAMENFLTEIGFSAWNLEQDRGRPIAVAVAELSERFPQHSHLIRAYGERWEQAIAGPIQPTVDILRALKEAGYPLYGLSNWSAETFYRVREKYEFLSWFDAIVLSGEAKLIKPDPAIFQHFLEKVGRTAEECLFIDDSPANVEAANRLGFTAIRFTSPEQLQADLTKLNILSESTDIHPRSNQDILQQN